MLVLTGEDCKNLDLALTKEWAEGNRNNAYAYQNIYGQNTKNEHALLSIPFENTKLTLISGLIEKFIIDDKEYYTNFYKTENQALYLEKFFIDYGPNFIFNFYGKKILKSILLSTDKNALVVKYKGNDLKEDIIFDVQPLLSIKPYTELSKMQQPKCDIVKEHNYVKYTDEKGVPLFFYFTNGHFEQQKETLSYADEHYFIPGIFHFNLPKDKEIFFIASTERLKEEEIYTLFANEIQLRESLIQKLNIKNELYKNFVLSSSMFLSHKDGYSFLKNSLIDPGTSFQGVLHSFTLLYFLKRMDIIKEILKYLAKHIKNGFMPEFYDDSEQKFKYTSIDNSLWYLMVLYDFIEQTGDWKFIKDFLWEHIRQIFYELVNGFDKISVDNDGMILLKEGMNAGKLIEYSAGKNLSLNILWYNALKIIELLAAKFADINLHSRSDEVSFQIRKNFYLKFWNKNLNYLNAVIDIPPHNHTDDSFKPYQIFTLSFPFDDLLHTRQKFQLLHMMKEKLLTPFGLKTLSPDSPKYIKNYKAQQQESAYHGTIHPYLLAHYITGLLKMNHYSKETRDEAKYLLLNFEKKTKENIVGFFPQYVSSLPPYNSAGILDYSLSLAYYIYVRTKELDSI